MTDIPDKAEKVLFDAFTAGYKSGYSRADKAVKYFIPTMATILIIDLVAVVFFLMPMTAADVDADISLKMSQHCEGK